MKKKLIMKSIILFAFLFILQPINGFASGISIDDSNANKGVVAISYQSDASKKIKVMIEKDGGKYTYNLNSQGKTEFFPLQMGSGSYKVSVLENTTGNKYIYLDSKQITASIPDDVVVFLNSIQTVNYKDSNSAVALGKQLANSEDPNAQSKAIYDYTVQNLSYDYDKIPSLKPGYNPDIEQTIVDKKGICYDYSAVLAGIARSQGIPTRLVKGYAKGIEGYHAWNEIYIDGQWQIIDSTFDSALNKSSVKTTMVKNAADYQRVNIY